MKKESLLNFLAATYLECVSDKIREDLFFDQEFSAQELLQKFKSLIDTGSYEDILRELKGCTNSDMIIMLQTSGGNPISHCIEYDDIVVLADSESKSKERCIPIMRSELRDYYLSSSDILTIGQSIKIVTIEEAQYDHVVGYYRRPPCTIAFIAFNYGIDSCQNEKYIYFALFYKGAENLYLPSKLESIRNLLLFRPYLMARIKRDFENDVYGKNKQTAWVNGWLAIDKAGAHADSRFIDAIIERTSYEYQCFNVLFFNKPHAQSKPEKDQKEVSQLLSNILIARYFRLVIPSNSKSAERKIVESIDDGETLGDLIPFGSTGIHAENKTIVIDYINTSAEALNSRPLYCKEANPVYSGLSCGEKKGFKKKYLTAFMVDVFNNIIKRGGERVDISIEDPQDGSVAYLIIKNDVSLSDKEIYGDSWDSWNDQQREVHCAKKNYGLKQSIEFENAMDPTNKKGMSLGSFSAFICAFEYRLKACYTYSDGKIWYSIKLPILKSLNEKENNNEIINN